MSAPVAQPPSEDEPQGSVLSVRASIRSLLDRLLGPPLSSREQDAQKIGPWRGVPALGLDGLGSSAYGPEAALMVLLPLGAGGLRYIGPLMALICVLLVILYFSYRQTIAAYPSGGGAYSVAKSNLGTQAALTAAAALTVDYLLNVAVGISAGVGALVSAFPVLHPFTLELCLGVLALLTIMNLRGTRESSLLVGFPTYAFVGSLLLVLGIGLVKTSFSGGHPAPVVQPPEFPHETTAVSLWLLVRSFASGCTAMTGVEAVSNGVTAFSQPVVRNAHWTLTMIVGTLLLLLMGIAHLSVAYGVGAIPQSSHHYQSIISQLTGAIVGRGLLYYVTIASLLAVLSLSANTSFAGFPRLCRVVAEDDFLPHAFANLGRRLVYSLGITILASLSAVLLIVFGGVTDRLIPLFAVGAFLAFTISQASMVVHWKREPGFRTNFPMTVNAVGACATAVALLIIIVAKFREGAWLTVLIIPSLVLLFNRIRAHYARVARATACRGALDTSPLRDPIAVVPIGGWNTVAEKCLRYALNTSRHVEVFFVYADENEASQLRQNWAKFVEGPLKRADMACPRLITVSSPYRLLYEPVIKHVKQLRLENPETYVNVFVPELVQTRWFEYLLHNQRALGLKALLLFQRDPYIVVTSVPWYLDDAC